MLIKILVAFLVCAQARADTPANCLFEDIEGTWIFEEAERTGENDIACDELGEIVYTKKFTLDFPNIVRDELGHEGTWTLIYNQGFEVNINERSYFAFSYYTVSEKEVTSYCDRTFNGWSRDETVRNWSCFKAKKETSVAPKKTQKWVKRNDINFINDLAFINKINKMQNSWTAKAYDQFEKYTVEDMIRKAGGAASINNKLPPAAPSTLEMKRKIAYYPKNFDWRNVEGVSYVSPVRDQENCGSCYTFASAGALEARVRIQTHNRRQDVFSTQDVVSCSNLSQGCEGGFSYLIAGRYAKEQGVVSEECFEYLATDEICRTNTTCHRTYVSEYHYVGGYYGACNEELMIEALVESGPIPVAFMVYDDFKYYSGGIYHHTGYKGDFNPLEITSHAVLLVGYGVDEQTNEKFWTIKNSWGSDWGEDGYFRIRRGNDEVGIESCAFDFTVIP